MKTLREAIQFVAEKNIALGHFNVSDSTQLRAIAEAARELAVPVLIGVSEGERSFLGVHHIAALVKSYRDQGQEIYLNADHTKSYNAIVEAVDAGFDEVLFDGSELSMEDNIAQTQKAVAYARACGRDVLVEGELGYIGSGSKLLDKIPEGAGLEKTNPEIAASFVANTGIDLIAPSVGNIHGLLKGNFEKRLDLQRIAAIRDAAQVPIVLHGGSGTNDSDFTQAIQHGVRIVHINTEIRLAYRKGIETVLVADPDEVSPAKYLGGGLKSMKEVVLARLKLFSGIS